MGGCVRDRTASCFRHARGTDRASAHIDSPKRRVDGGAGRVVLSNGRRRAMGEPPSGASLTGTSAAGWRAGAARRCDARSCGSDRALRPGARTQEAEVASRPDQFHWRGSWLVGRPPGRRPRAVRFGSHDTRIGTDRFLTTLGENGRGGRTHEGRAQPPDQARTG